MREQDWPRDWTPRERVETVANEQISTETRVCVEMIADDAGVDAETARRVVHEMANHGTIYVIEINDRLWVSRQPDYSDTRWGEVDNT